MDHLQCPECLEGSLGECCGVALVTVDSGLNADVTRSF